MKKEIIITIAAHVVELGQASSLTMGPGQVGWETSRPYH